ncbi:hypothetical protein ACFQ0O_28195 [Saccharopolyspora spinosporotrichia]
MTPPYRRNLPPGGDTNSDPNVPAGHITAFDRSQYERLIKAVDSVDHSLSQQFLKPGTDIRLDESLGSRLHVGSDSWSAVTDFINAANKFGTSVDTINEKFSDDWRGFIKALNAAKDVFDDTNNLANYSAQKFLNDYPEIGGEEPPRTAVVWGRTAASAVPAGWVVRARLAVPAGLVVRARLAVPAGWVVRARLAAPAGLVVRARLAVPAGLVVRARLAVPAGLVVRARLAVPAGLVVRARLAAPAGLVVRARPAALARPAADTTALQGTRSSRRIRRKRRRTRTRRGSSGRWVPNCSRTQRRSLCRRRSSRGGSRARRRWNRGRL